MSDKKPDLHIRGVKYRPHEAEARELAAETMSYLPITEDGTVTLRADVMAEILVGNSFDGFLVGLARGMRIYHDASAYLQGVEEGRLIERRRINGYTD